MKASTSKNTSKPLSRANAIVISKKPQSRVGNQQPSSADLKKLGIKVRDFAYEKTLPPVRTVHLHRQVLPGVARQTITRQKTEEDASQSQQSQNQSRMADRTPTEPSLTPVPLKRARGLFDLELEESDDENTTLSQQISTPEFLSNTQIPQIPLDSQKSQPRAETPVVTPWNWDSENSSGVPHSQDNNAPIPQTLSNSHPSVSLDNRPTGSTSRQSLPSSPLTPAPSPPNLHVIPPATLPHPTPSNGARTFSSTSRNHHADSTKELRCPATPKAISPRYHLRKRPAPPVAAPKSSKRLKVHRSPEKCNVTVSESSRPHPASVKSMHSRNKPHEDMTPPSPPTLRQHSTSSKRGKRKRA